MLLAIFLLFRHAINRLENHLHQHLVAIQHGVQHCQSLSVRLGDALIQTHRRNLHQQRRLLVLVRQFEIMAHHRLYDKGPVQMIGTRDGATRHQVILLATDDHWLRQIVTLRIGVERTRLQVDAHLRISTHIDRTVESRLQELDIEAELVLISPPSRII